MRRFLPMVFLPVAVSIYKKTQNKTKNQLYISDGGENRFRTRKYGEF